ncbi:Aste57867_8444 [Aphanomyces stellatus]|uniref:Aste57867_8444 protein n=1 Tax=Aphanomyces stellatus TaxID=120398 RepID=A0A485KKC5_9STRA|nr:hypothetical protein As57867_008412 [Aphanomyces stellatus]VFT85330.1 Aste57867_8444 [Aphanomyces stellatus]
MSPAHPTTPPINSATTHDASKTITVTTASEHRQLAAAESGATTFVNCHLVAPPCDDAERQPIDLVVVLDRSGSMAGHNLDLCKKTMQFLVDQLAAHDRVAVVSYGSTVTTDMPLAAMTLTGKQTLMRTVLNIHASGGTNLSAGLLAGIDEILHPSRRVPDSVLPPNPVQSVLLLTDGQANEGITNVPLLVRMVEGSLPTNVSLYTFGYGFGHDAGLLGQLAEIGRGAFYFVQNVDRVALAFADCLGGLLSVVAQNIKVECVAKAGVTIQAVKTKRHVTTIQAKTHVEIDLGDLFADETRDVLLHIQVESTTPTTKNSTNQHMMDLIEFRLRYANVLLARLDTTTAVVAIERPDTVTDTTRDELVVAQKQRVATADAMEAAQAAAARGDFSQARATIQTTHDALKDELKSMSDDASSRAACLVNDLTESLAHLATPSAFMAGGQSRMVQQAQGFGTQRWNRVDDTTPFGANSSPFGNTTPFGANFSPFGGNPTLFGSTTTTTTTSGFSFGGATVQSAPSTSGFSFGGTPVPPTSGGATVQPATSTSGFSFGGQTVPAVPPTSGFGGFGQPAPATPAFGAFGSPTTSAFGFSSTSSGGFGGGFGQPAPSSTFGHSATNATSRGSFAGPFGSSPPPLPHSGVRAYPPDASSKPAVSFGFSSSSSNAAYPPDTRSKPCIHFGATSTTQQSGGFGASCGAPNVDALASSFGAPSSTSAFGSSSTTSGYFGAPNTKQKQLLESARNVK